MKLSRNLFTLGFTFNVGHVIAIIWNILIALIVIYGPNWWDLPMVFVGFIISTLVYFRLEKEKKMESVKKQ